MVTSSTSTSPQLPPGIRVVQRKSGETRYVARVHRAGLREYNQTFASLEEAIRWRQKTELLLDSGITPEALQRKYQRKQMRERIASAEHSGDKSASLLDNGSLPALTVADAVTAYIKRRQSSHKPLPANYLTDYQRVRDDLGPLPASALSNEDLVNYISLLLNSPLKRETNKPVESRRSLSAATVRKYIYALKKALEWNAKNRGLKLNPHLFKFESGVMPAAWSSPRERRLSADEEQRLYAAGIERGDATYSSEDWRRLIGFALETAMRAQEIAMARWRDLRDEGYQLYIPASHSKTKSGRTVVLSKRARDIIELQRQGLPPDDSESRIFYQFPNARAISFAFARLTKRAGIENLHFHDLRHEATSRLCESGQMNLMAIMEMTGHRSMRTFQGYVHLINTSTKVRLD